MDELGQDETDALVALILATTMRRCQKCFTWAIRMIESMSLREACGPGGRGTA